MKFFILFFFLFLLSCTSEKQESFVTSCPEVFFSKDHRIYITTEESSITLHNISYKAEINNYNITKECFIKDNKITTTLSILFVVKPEKAKEVEILLPYYVALLDDENNIVNIQYYKAKGLINKNIDNTLFVDTEITTTQNVIISTQDINEDSFKKLLIGFMLNQEQLEFLN